MSHFYCYDECRSVMLSDVMPNSIIQNVIMLNVIMKNVIMPNVIILNVIIKMPFIKKRLESRIDPSLVLKYFWQHIKNNNSANNNDY